MVEIPGYKIEKELGSGGMATVYLAIQQSVERQVALKVMSPLLMVDRSFSDRFIREARIAANLYHPNVVAVYDVGLHEGQPYIAMEYMPAGDLAARCGGKALELPFAMRVAREIATALNYAHGKGFVHRDVKPENILFREDDTAVLSDFGIARAVDSATQMTKTGAIIGTPQYMSPEQARGKDLDGRSDLYGLGIVIFEMLTGKVPFEGADSISVGIKHVTEPVPKLPPRLAFAQPLMDQLLAKNPEDRFQSGAEAARALREFETRSITGESERVRTPTPEPAIKRRRTTEPETAFTPEFVPTPDQGSAPPQTEAEAPPAAERPAERKEPGGVGVSATPRPDGKLRQEPTLGSLDDIRSFDRTVGQARLDVLKKKALGPPQKRRRTWFLALLLVVAAAGASWWQRERLLTVLPNPQVNRLLERASSAIDYDHYYGETLQYANRLYRRVLEIDPDNRRARAGLELIAQHFADQAEQAYANGNSVQAGLLLERARELAPDLPRLEQLRREFEGLMTPGLVDTVNDQPEQPVSDGVDARIATLLAEAESFRAQGVFVRPPVNNALARYQAVLALDENQPDAIEGIRDLRDALRQRVRGAIASEAFETAASLLADLSMVTDPSDLSTLRDELEAARRRQQAAEEGRLRQAAEQARLEELRKRLEEAAALASSGDRQGAVAAYREVLAADPGNAEAQGAIDRIARSVLGRAEVALEEDELDRAENLIAEAAELEPQLPGLERARDRLELYRSQRQRPTLTAAQRERIEGLIAAAQQAMDEGNLMEPPGGSAYDNFKAALSLDPDNPDVIAGMRNLSDRLAAMAGRAVDSGNLDMASGRLNDARQTDPFNPRLDPLARRVAAAFRQATRAAIAEARLGEAQTFFEEASRLEPDHADLDQLQLSLLRAREGG